MRIEFICIIWTLTRYVKDYAKFLRIEFICIIWTDWYPLLISSCSWGLNLFVLFERSEYIVHAWIGSWGLNLFVLFERIRSGVGKLAVLEDWIYLYYLNPLAFVGLQGLVLEDWIYLYYLNSSIVASLSMPVLEDWIYLYYLNRRSMNL